MSNSALLSSVSTPSAPRFRLNSFQHPDSFPNLVGWFRSSRRNALELFPKQCFTDYRLDHKVLNNRFSVVSDPETIKKVFGSMAHQFKLCNLHLRILKPSLGNGLIVSQGKDWKRLRGASLAILKRTAGSKLADSDPINVSASSSRLAQNYGHREDFASYLSRFVLDQVAMKLLGHRRNIAELEISHAIEQHREISERMDLWDILGVNPKLKSNKMRKAGKIARQYDRLILEEIRGSAIQPPEKIDPSEYRDLIVNLLTGFESIWLVCLWTLLIMANSSDLFAWYKEPSKKNDRYARLQSIINEVMRLYPPLPLIYREAINDVELPSGKYSKGQLICIAPYIVQRHALNWEEADIFAVDRPTDMYKSVAFMPFGVGMRKCIAANRSPKLIIEILDGLLTNHVPINNAHFPMAKMGLSLRPDGHFNLNLKRI